MASEGDRARRRKPPLQHERRILLYALAIGLPSLLVALVLLWLDDHSTKVRWTFTVIVGLFWLGTAFALREQVIRPLQTLSNMLAALREEDFSIRARGARADDALGLALLEANTLGETLRSQRLGAVEAATLMRKVMAEVDVAMFAFDALGRLRLVNRAGERLLGEPAHQLLNRGAGSLGLDELLQGERQRTMDLTFARASGRWEVRRSVFRQDGLPHELLVLTDVSRTLREEELQAWRRLVRVLSHEINNSLAPIQSVAVSMREMVRRNPRPSDWESDLARGLGIIAGRSKALGHFIASYARLTRLPLPRRNPLDVAGWVRRVAVLETRIAVEVDDGPPLTLHGDGEQLDQLLINLVRNAVDASLETGGGVTVGWERVNGGAGGTVELRVVDDGPGIPETANLFVPFFTTKPEGSGIGLALSRQIAEAHGGSLVLANRPDHAGCEARLRLPLR